MKLTAKQVSSITSVLTRDIDRWKAIPKSNRGVGIKVTESNCKNGKITRKVNIFSGDLYTTFNQFPVVPNPTESIDFTLLLNTHYRGGLSLRVEHGTQTAKLGDKWFSWPPRTRKTTMMAEVKAYLSALN